ncbi:pol polyprotein [Daphnia sinensis]|uniref:RNA-directed DNA polymerase n=1 Tax=Daphnia sinensis TaxID=1820382 RepID=A0AAD5KHA4_9CRUS|nr:pol polyprotein [Daphnia sinensis]
MKPEDKKKTAFITANGLYQFKVMPFGLTNAPTVLKCLSKANLKLKLSKCSFGATSLKILGYIVSGAGISPDPTKVNAVSLFPTPCSVKEIQSFIGLCSYYRRFIKNFATLARPLIELTKKNNPFLWSTEQQKSFDALKNALITPPVLGHPNYTLPMEIHCDACSFGIGAVLVQQQMGQERVLAYASRLLSPAERNYAITEQECLALVWAVQKFKIFIWGTKIKVITDHHALCWLLRKKNLTGRLARWSLQLQDLDIEVVYKSGRLHTDADALSRHPIEPPEPEPGIPMLLCDPPSLTFPDSPDIPSLQQECIWWQHIIQGLKRKDPEYSIRHLTRNFLLKNNVLYHRRCLISGFAEELFRAMQTNHLITTAYHPQCNGLVERFNHTFAEMLSMFVNSKHSNWDSVIDHVVFAYNTSRQESTGETPFFLLYGREAVLPIDVALGNNPNPCSDNDPLQFIKQLPILRERVKRRILQIQHRQRKQYNRHRQPKTYAEGDLVWLHRPVRKKGRSEKLLHSYHGPFVVTQKFSDVSYGVRNQRGRKKTIDRVHVCNLKPYFSRADTLQSTTKPIPLSFSQKDDAIVESVDDAIVESVDDAIVGSVDDAIVGSVDDAIVGSVDDAIVESVDDAIVESVDDAIVGSVDDAIVESVDDAIVGSRGDVILGEKDDAISKKVDDTFAESQRESKKNQPTHPSSTPRLIYDNLRSRHHY